jgi:23S rRNA pseudouridine2605 synthase
MTTRKSNNKKSSEDTGTTRLNKFLANNSEFARRKIDEMIQQGRVTVNHKLILEPGVQIDNLKDEVRLDGERIREKTKKTYILLHKPIGFITTTDDEKNRKTVMDIIKTSEKLFPIGRLDIDTSGVLLLTNDGDFANKLMHPKFKVQKTYIVNLSRPLDEKIRLKLAGGIKLDGKKTAPAKIEFVNKDVFDTVAITLTEGRNRQVRRMFENYGFFVRKLHRSLYGHLTVDGLNAGEYRKLSIQEINKFTNK